jgi:zinc transporter ZupT
MTAPAIGIHSFPEGPATFAAALSDVPLGIFTWGRRPPVLCARRR